MSEQTCCRTCRFWSLLRDGAVIGRCAIAEQSKMQFPRGTHCCGCWQARHGQVEASSPPEPPPARPRPGTDRSRR